MPRFDLMAWAFEMPKSQRLKHIDKQVACKSYWNSAQAHGLQANGEAFKKLTKVPIYFAPSGALVGK